MNERRNFLKLASAVALPAAAAVVSGGVVRADDGSVKEFLGSWSTLHDLLPELGGSFREFLSFEESGAMHETNSFLHNSSNLENLIPGRKLNASDGFGNWTRVGNGVIQVDFRKMLFDAMNHNENFGDLHVTGTLHSDGKHLTAQWFIEVRFKNGDPAVPFGTATSSGGRIGTPEAV